jgi:hypothetical protein
MIAEEQAEAKAKEQAEPAPVSQQMERLTA